MSFSATHWLEIAYSAHADSIFRYFRSRGVAPQDAHDLVQITFEAALKTRGSVVPDDALPYLISIARYKLADHKKQVTDQITTLAALTHELGAAEGEFRAGRRTSWSRPQPNGYLALHEAIDSLGSIAREAIQLAYFDDLPGQTCADALGVSYENVRKILSNARAALRAQLDPPEPQAVRSPQRGAPTTEPAS